MQMKVLIIGSGAKENSIIWKLSQSPMVKEIFYIDDNIQTEALAINANLKIDNFPEILGFIYKENINLTIVCSKKARAKGLVEYLTNNKVIVIGGNAALYKFEKSQNSTRNFLNKYKIKTPNKEIFENSVQAINSLQKRHFPLFIKYEGITEGAGVFFCTDENDAKKRILKCFELNHKSLIIEDYIKGREITLNVLTDGYNAIPLPICYVYKRILDGEGGAYTSGMGAYAPLDFVDTKIEAKIAHKIIYPLIDAFLSEGYNYTGILQAQIIIDERDEMYLLGIKSDFGAIEAQTILPLIEDDFFNLLYSTATGALEDISNVIKTIEGYSVSVQVRSGLITGKPLKDQKIHGLELFDNDDIYIFQNEIKTNDYTKKVTNGECILTAVSTGSTLRRAFDNVYSELKNLKFKGIYYRKDIAKSYLDYKNLLQDVKM